MQRYLPAIACLAVLLSPVLAQNRPSRGKANATKTKQATASLKPTPPAPATGVSVEEARRTVELLNDVYQVSLQEIHRRFPIGGGQPIVAALVIRDIQKRVSNRRGVQSRFLAVDTRAMNLDHAAKDAFERRAVEKLAAGARRWEVVENGQLRVATVVPLGGTCFPCHSTAKGDMGRAAISWKVALGPTSGQE